jgi:hypothetical protein
MGTSDHKAVEDLERKREGEGGERERDLSICLIISVLEVNRISRDQKEGKGIDGIEVI